MNIQIFQFYSAYKASGLILSKQVFERLTPSVSLAQIGEVKSGSTTEALEIGAQSVLKLSERPTRFLSATTFIMIMQSSFPFSYFFG